MHTSEASPLPGQRPWTPDELDRIRRTGEVHISSRRRDGSYTAGRTIWVVAVGARVFVRSTDGPDKPWFQAAKARGVGRLRCAGRELPVSISQPRGIDENLIEQTYRAKYRSSWQGSVNRAGSSRATLELIPLAPPVRQG